MTTQSVPDAVPRKGYEVLRVMLLGQLADEAPVLPRRNPGSALAVLALADELSEERTAHLRTRRDLAEVRKAYRAAAGLVQGWGLPWIGGRVPPAPEPLPVDLSVRPLIFDQLVAERTPPRRRRLRRRGVLAVAAATVGGIALYVLTHPKGSTR